MQKKIRVLNILFDTIISYEEITFFRGAVLNCLGDKANLLYHNHIGVNGFRYSYPLIQYKRIRGKAAIVCIEEGIDVIFSLLASDSFQFQLGYRKVEMFIEEVKANETYIKCMDHMKQYKLVNWLPLNSDNYIQYQSMDSLADKIKKLEEILTSNILSMLKGIDIILESTLIVNVQEITNKKIIKYKGIKLMAFDVVFKTNIGLPYNIGIGKSASVGYGVIAKI